MIRIGEQRIWMSKMLFHKLIQININHCWDAYNLLQQYMTEHEIAIAIISEPIHIPQDNCACSTDQKAIITWKAQLIRAQCKTVSIGEGFVAIMYNKIVLFSCYISPNIGTTKFEEILDELEYGIKRLNPHYLIICGDFNAKSTAWGSLHTCPKGKILEDWAIANELILVNKGSTPTCTRQQGDSIIDTTWVNPRTTSLLHDWRVTEDAMTYSDHNYIEFSLGDKGLNKELRTRQIINRSNYPKWSTKNFDSDIFAETIECYCEGYNKDPDLSSMDPHESALWIKRVMTDASDISMKRMGTHPRRRQVHWWNTEIQDMRRTCIQSRRKWTRAKKRKRNCQEELKIVEQEHRINKKALTRAILKAKEESWKVLIDTIEENPWGIPYKLVMGKLRASAPGLTETLSPSELNKIISDLFPQVIDDRKHYDVRIDTWDPDWDVTADEVYRAIHGKANNSTAPGPDGITIRIWKQVPNNMIQVLSKIFTEYMKTATFPKLWKIAKLVLIPKNNSTNIYVDGKIKARPICLVDDVSKILERVIMNRINEWMDKRLSDGFWIISYNQFGFRKNRSTIDALIKVRQYIERNVAHGNIVIAISLDIKNAFNSIPWNAIRRALVRKRFPSYLRRILHNYLQDRYIEYIDMQGSVIRYPVTAGVPQGSVIGPMLWNVAYDTVLMTEKDLGCEIICYADDTLLLVSGSSYRDASAKASMLAESVLERITGIGLTVAVEKTEILAFHKRKGTIPLDAAIKINNVEIKLKKSMKYLGLILDGQLKFEEHFKYVNGKVAKVNRALCKLLPNLRGPRETKRKLYANIVQSIVLYGAPIWSDKLQQSKFSQRILRNLQRTMAIRIIAGYRTISFDIATILARTPPWALVATKYAEIYKRIQELKTCNSWTKQLEKVIKNEEDDMMIESWRREWESTLIPKSPLRRAIAGPNFIDWLQRPFGGMNFHLTQVLSDHGCFRKFLHRIRKADSTMCLHCGDGIDNAQHTLFACNSWQADRRETFDSIGCDAMEDIIQAICTDNDKWKSFNLFVNNIMIQKENLEREREMEGGRQRSGNRNRYRNRRRNTDVEEEEEEEGSVAEDDDNICGNEDNPTS